MRRRILLLVVGMTTLVVLAFAIPLAILIRHNAYNDGIAKLRKETSDIALYLRGSNSARTSAQITAALADLDSSRYASVQLSDGTVVGRRPPGGLDGAPPVASRVDPARPSPASGGPGAGYPGDAPGGFESTPMSFRGGLLVQQQVPVFRPYGQQAGSNLGSYVIRVYADDSTLRSGQNGPYLLLIGATVVLIAIGIGAGEIMTRRIVKPLLRTAVTAQQLSAGDTSARAPTDGPGEVAEVGLALNRLADRIDQLIAEERETTADMSHRLRTPMTALRLDAEALHDPGEAERVGNHVTTLERMLTAVIHAARRGQREGRMPSSDATAVVGERVEFWSALAEDQGRTVGVDLPSHPLVVRAGDEDLAAAVDALLENVIAHTPEGTAFEVGLSAADGGARLEISDDGPGLPEDAHVRGRSDRGSTGLGLDIARRCAEASGGSMTLGRSASGGACVVLELHAS